MNKHWLFTENRTIRYNHGHIWRENEIQREQKQQKIKKQVAFPKKDEIEHEIRTFNNDEAPSEDEIEAQIRTRTIY